MRIKIIALIIGLVIYASVSSQNTNNYKYQSYSTQNHCINTLSKFQKTLSKGIFQPDDSSQRILSKKFLLNLAYFDIIIYDKEIETLYSKKDSLLKYDTLLYLECLKNEALLSYQKNDFSVAAKEFQQYFHQYQSLYHIDTTFAFEYSKYCTCIERTKSEKDYFSVMDSAIFIANKKIQGEGDLALAYMGIGAHFLFQRQIDTARYLIAQAKRLVENTPTKHQRLQSDLFILLAKQEIINENFDLAVAYIDKAINTLLNTRPSEIALAHAYNFKAIALMYAHRHQEAIKIQEMALYIFEKYFPHNHSYVLTALRFLAINYSASYKFDDAIKTYNKILSYQKKPADYLLLRDIARTYAKVNNIKKAADYFNLCLKKNIQTTGVDSYQVSVTYYSFGQFLLEKAHDYTLGEGYLKKSIIIKYHVFKGPAKDMIGPLNILGTYYLNTGQIDRGLDSLQTALTIAIKDFNNKDIYVNPQIKDFTKHFKFHNTLAWKAYGLYLRYLQTKNLRDLKASFQTYNEYAVLSKEIRKYYQKSENIITSKEIFQVYEQAVQIGSMLYEQTGDSNYLNSIFSLMEGKKSFTLLNSLNILEKKRLLKVPKELLDSERNLQQQLGIINEKIDTEKSYKSSTTALQQLNKTAFKITIKLDSIRKIYKSQYSGFFQLKYGFKYLSLNEIQEKIQPNHAFLNYLISDSLLSIMCITHEKVQFISQEVDSSFFTPLRELISLQKKINTDNAYLEFHHFIKDSRLLYKYLIAPFDSLIEDKELVFIPDNILSYISFDALLTSDIDINRPDYSRLPYLIKEHQSNVANSMEIYFNMKAKPKSHNLKVYAFAPSYQDAHDTAGLPNEYKFLRPLEYSNKEIRSIAQYFPTKLYLNQEAKKDSFSLEAKHAKILHLAMHTIIDNQKPMYSKLLFTYDTIKKEGMVNTYELLNMDLDADLAVLSGCSTGDGELQKGEGVMSLSTGFQYAGIPAIVMSLWEVNDKYGGLVIDDFYKYLAMGLPKNQCLHQAKLDVLNKGNALYAHPFYWAGLTLMGDDSKIIFKEKKPFNFNLLYLPGIIIIVFSFWWYQRKKTA